MEEKKNGEVRGNCKKNKKWERTMRERGKTKKEEEIKMDKRL